ncbi:DUF6907 domain-containing protein [Paractinoplanes durhamensis]|uniref:Uncharacterized protein n=1 Tax=Paractinoplanes durhamensis TaxID=113563 RepID=A0ABQ3ZD06_9ACTN|nr:hypothetical protein [Actinoplanes durhamensis]GIE07704.1 hypothetical protein Adu01nite_90540 [Actinoplanes durhamensis]
MSKVQGHVIDGLTFPTLRAAVEEIADWRWYAVPENSKVKLVRRLGARIAEIRWDGHWWRWQILDGKQSVLMNGSGGRLTEALIGAELAQPYEYPVCPAWCADDHSTRSGDNSRFHSIEDEITVGSGGKTATVGTCCTSAPHPDAAYGPVVYVGGLDDCDMTVAEAEALRVALARAIERAAEAQQLSVRDGERRRQSSIRQRTSMDMRSYAPPLAGEKFEGLRVA